MTGFSRQWLTLREAADRTARSSALVGPLRRAPGVTLKVTDLGAGTGANLSFLAPLLGGEQIWRLVDNDPVLLAEVPETLKRLAHAHGGCLSRDGEWIVLKTSNFGCRVRMEQRDLARELCALQLSYGELLTASALLDLVSLSWLRELAQKARGSRSPLLFALSYDGRVQCIPPLAVDGRVRELVNAHQHSDKGFGPALGPDAVSTAARLFSTLGYATETAVSDWQLDATDTELCLELIDGWLVAALELAVSDKERSVLGHWAKQRRALLGEYSAALMVGHLDLVAWPS